MKYYHFSKHKITYRMFTKSFGGWNEVDGVGGFRTRKYSIKFCNLFMLSDCYRANQFLKNNFPIYPFYGDWLDVCMEKWSSLIKNLTLILIVFPLRWVKYSWNMQIALCFMTNWWELPNKMWKISHYSLIIAITLYLIQYLHANHHKSVVFILNRHFFHKFHLLVYFPFKPPLLILNDTLQNGTQPTKGSH